MKTNESYDYAFNAQMVVNEKPWMIIAVKVVQEARRKGILTHGWKGTKSLRQAGIERKTLKFF